MKKLIMFIILSCLSFSWVKEDLVPNSEIPGRLKDIITQHEKAPAVDEKSPVAITV